LRVAPLAEKIIVRFEIGGDTPFAEEKRDVID
jgi:hypothetical protein